MTARTLPAQLLERARSTPGRTAYRHKRLGVWEVGTWEEYAADAAAAGLALDALGVQAGDRVAVAAGNRPEWLLADLGAQGIGAVTVAVPPGASGEEVSSLLSAAAASVVVCEDEEQLDKVNAVRAGLPGLRALVVIDTRGVRALDDPLLHTWSDLLARGRALEGTAWEQRVDALDPEAAAVLLHPDVPGPAVELSSSRLLAAAAALRSAVPVGPADEVLSSLPPSCGAEWLTSVAGALAVGCVVSFGEGGASFPRDLREVQPTVLLGTPRTWERMRQTAEGRMADATLVKRAVYRWCVAQGREVSARLAAGSPKATDPARRALCWLLCLRQLRHKLGLGRIATAVTTGTTDAQVLQWFEAIGAPLRDGWGPALEAELGPLLGSWSSTHAAGRVAP